MTLVNPGSIAEAVKIYHYPNVRGNNLRKRWSPFSSPSHTRLTSAPLDFTRRELCEWIRFLCHSTRFDVAVVDTSLQNNVGSNHLAQGAYSCVWAGLNYLVKIDSEGKLRWERTGQLVDTTAGHWKDAGYGRGIVPEEHPNRPNLRPRTSFGSSGSLSSISVAPSGSMDGSGAVTHYASDTKSGNWLQRAAKRNLTPKGLMDKLLKKTVKRNTWIYVSVCGSVTASCEC